MKILFYLPVIIPRWFERLFAPLIEKLVPDNEVHILAPASWRGTGLGERELALCAHLPNVSYHTVNDPDHPSMRTLPIQGEGLVNFVQTLCPDYTLCRSADLETIKAFPGIVRQITEGGAEPLPVDTIHLTQSPFDHGLLPDLNSEQIAQLERMIAPFWDRLVSAGTGNAAQQETLVEWANLPSDRPTLFVPLEYEDQENFFTQHRLGARPNARWVEELAELWGDKVYFAFTNHPLNIARLDNSAVERMVQSYADCARLYPFKTPLGTPTSALLARHSDAMLLCDSKMFSLAAAHGLPIIRQSKFRSGDWLGAYEQIDAFLDAHAKGRAKAPDPKRARLWFAFHIANNLINLEDPNFTASDLFSRLDRPVDADRWERNFAFYAKDW